MSKLQECHDKLIEIFDGKGFLTFDEIIDTADFFELSVSDVDRLSEILQLRGIIIYDKAPGDTSAQVEDYSQIDYSAIYSEAAQIAPELTSLIDEIRKISPIQHGEISVLTNQAANGNVFARERLILTHLRIVLKIALLMSKQYELDLSDAVSEGYCGLVHATDSFDVNGYSAFQSYVSLWIQQFIQRGCRSCWEMRYYPTHIRDKVLSIAQLCRERYGDIEPSSILADKELVLACAKQLDVSTSEAQKLLQYFTEDLLFYNCNNEDDVPFYQEIDEDAILEKVERHYLNLEIDKALNELTENQRTVIKLRYGFSGEDLTLNDIGKKLNVTRERARQIEERALKKLRNSVSIRKLKKKYYIVAEPQDTPKYDRNKSQNPTYNFNRLRQDIIASVSATDKLYPVELTGIDDVKNLSNAELLKIAPIYGINPEKYIIYS